MRNAETILNIIRERGVKRLPLGQVYRQLYNPELYLYAYSKIGRNQGAMTPGVTNETVNGMNLDKIQVITDALREEKYRFKPTRRVYIEKKNSRKKRPLGIPMLVSYCTSLQVTLGMMEPGQPCWPEVSIPPWG